MKTHAKRPVFRWLMLLLLAPAVFAQDSTTGEPGHVYTQPEIDQLLAPIALYPDALLSQILMAATYPLEIVEAARWSRANPQLKGAQAVQAVDDRGWDPSVKSLVAFPQILNMMDTKLEWTERLGDVFLAQESDVMDEVQSLRERAASAGNLQSSGQQRVERRGDTIVIEPADPAVVYVPYYDPAAVYGPWWWPVYPPVYWGPWPGYYVTPGFVGITWGIGVGVGVNFFFGAWDWPHHHIRVVDVPPFYYRRVRPLPPERIWQHDPNHRRGVPYRDAEVREKFRRIVPSPEQRRDYRGYVPRPPDGGAERTRDIPRGGGERLRPNTPVIRPVPGTAPTSRAPDTSRLPIRPGAPGSITRPEPRPHVFEGVGQGPDVRRYSERGRASAPPPAYQAPSQPPPRSSPRSVPAPAGAPRDGGAAPQPRGNR